jgi:hypothetical protein
VEVTMKMLTRWMIVVAIGLSMAGCGDVDRTSTSPAIDATGTWTGILGTPGSGSALRMTWVASQSGSLAAGPMTLVKPAPNVPATGPLTGVVSGSQLLLTYNVPSGSVTGFASCSILGSGSGTLSGSTITGMLPLMFTSCSGASSGLEPPASSQFTLTKQ